MAHDLPFFTFYSTMAHFQGILSIPNGPRSTFGRRLLENKGPTMAHCQGILGSSCPLNMAVKVTPLRVTLKVQSLRATGEENKPPKHPFLCLLYQLLLP